jgi:DNA modification methylase
MLTTRTEILADGVTLHMGDCREILPTLARADAIVTDPPYGITDHEWDKVVPAQVWMRAPAVCFSAEPYSTELINSAPIPFKYDLVWAKNTVTNLENSEIRPGRAHERILIFGSLPYTPQKRRRTREEMSRLNATQRSYMEWAHPGSVLVFDAINNRHSERTEHPSQKPEDLLRWLLETYTLPMQIVLDPFMGSGTTGVAAARLGRRFVGIESEPKYFDIAARRIADALARPDLFIETPARAGPAETPAELDFATGRP